jgi:hypothetical protein
MAELEKRAKKDSFACKYPQLSSAELEEAKDNFRQYVALALRVFERLECDPEALRHFEALTALRCENRMNLKRPHIDTSKPQ